MADNDLFAWADTPWIVAALLGVWGVMIGSEEFFIADVFMILAAGFCTWRLAVDCFQGPRRRWLSFSLGSVVILAVVAVDIHLTAKKNASADAKAQEIPQLQSQISGLQGTISLQNTELSKAQGSTDQHVADIQRENRDLRKSIVKKDAALVSIAKQQYSLNFLPQVVAMVQQNFDDITVENLGKTNVTLYEMDDQGNSQIQLKLPQEIVPNATTSFSITGDRRTAIVNSAVLDPITKDYRATDECVLYLESQDGRRYSLPFTWTFIVADGKITKSFTTNHPITEVYTNRPTITSSSQKRANRN
jgi:hypothetical protein